MDVFSKDEHDDHTMSKKSHKPVRGMQLFKKKKEKFKSRQKKLQSKKEDLSDKIMKEEGQTQKKKLNPLDAPVIIEIREKISAKLSKNGELQSF